MAGEISPTPGFTIGGVQVWEQMGSGGGHYDKTDVYRTRVFRLAWSSVDTFCQFMLGISLGSNTRNPQRFPTNDRLLACATDIKEFPGTRLLDPDGSNFINYEWAQVTITYKSLLLSDSITRPELFSESYDFTAEFLTRGLDNAIHESAVQSTTLPPGFMIGTLIPGVEYEYKRARLDDVPRSTIYNCLGKVNNNTFLEADPKHVLYVGARASSSYDGQGARLWEVTHRFAIRGGGTWDEFYVPGSGWGQIRLGPGGPFQRMYDEANLNVLLTG